MSKLTKSQREIMGACPDWSAAWEIQRRLGRDTLGGIPTVLRRLKRRGQVEYGPANNTFRVTPAGRAALANGDEG